MNLPKYSHGYDGSTLIAPKEELAYLDAYRKIFHLEKFNSYTIEELDDLFEYRLEDGAMEYLASKGYDLQQARLLFPRFFLAAGEKEFEDIFFIGEEMKNKGLLRRYQDPFALFKDARFIVRGYRYGKAISTIIQDLPNISVAFDFGMEANMEKPIGITEFSDEESLEATIKELLRQNEDAYIYDPSKPYGGKYLSGPYVPSEGKFIIVDREIAEPSLPLDEKQMSIFRYETPEQKRQRLSVEMQSCRYSPRIIAFLRLLPRQDE